MKKILLATNNEGKRERYRKLLAHVGDFEVYTPEDLGIEAKDVVEDGATLAANAELKVRAYFGHTDLAIIGNDTGFFVEGEGFMDAPKRMALGDAHEKDLSPQEVANRLVEFWKSVARKHDGKVDATWIEAFAVLHPDGTLKTSEAKRGIILTDQEFGGVPLWMSIRTLYYSKATMKPAILHTEEEELMEMQPVIRALAKLLEN